MLKWFRKKRVLAGITAMTLVIGNANSVTLFAEGMPVDAVSPKEEVENIESVEITPDNASPTTDEDDGIEQVEFQGECTEKNEEGNSQEAGTMPESDPGNSMDAGLIEDELSENIMPPLEGDFASEGGDLLSDPEEADTNSEPADATSENEPEQIYTEGMDESGEETEATQSSEVIADTLDEGSQYGGFTYSISDGTATITGYTGPGGDIEIPGEIEGYAVTEIGNSAFSGQSEITGTILPESITSIGINAFRGTGIESITIPKNVTSCGWWNKTSETDYYNGPFAGATRLKEVTFAEGTKKVPAYILASYNLSSSVEKVILPEGVEEIGDYAFYYCRELSEITLPKTLKTIGDEAFDFCGTLVEIDLPNGLTKIGYKAFTSTGIKHVKIPNTLAICRRSRYYGPFGSTNSLEEVEFEPGIKKIPGNVLRNCFSVTKVSLPTGVEEIGDYAFSDCTNLQDINIPGSVKSIGDEAFSYCRNLEYISLPRNLKSIGYEAFMKTGIGKITIPKGLEKCGNYSNNGPFAGTTKLSKVVFEKGLKKIPDSTLSALSASPNPPTSKDLEKYGSYVTAVVIPDTVKSVGDSAFMNCNMLADIYYAGSEEKWKAVTVGQNNDPLLKAAVHYDWEEEPDGKTEKVKSDAYGVTEYESDAMGRIYDSIKEYSLAEYSFYDTIGARFKEDYKNAGKEANNFRQLRQYDEELGRKNKTNRMLTIEADDDAAIDDAYEVLYGFLKECLSTAEQENIIDLSDISSSDSTTLVESKMINKIYDSLKDGSRLYSGTGSNGYHVELMTGGIFHFFTGSASINGTKKGHMGSYTGAFCSSGALVSAAMNQFIEDLSEEVRKQAKDAAKSLWDYFRKESGIAAISKAYAEDIFKTHAGYLLQKGYGNLYMTIKKLFSGYEILRDVSRAKTATAAVKILNSSDLKAFYEQVKKTEYTDDEITNEVVKDGLDAVEKARKKLETALFDYLYNEDTYDSLSLGEKIEYKWKAFFQCPVNVEVYGQDGSLLGSVIDGAVSYDKRIYIQLSGDGKIVYVPDGLPVQYRITGTDDGTLNYVVEEYKDGNAVGRMNYYDIPLEEGVVYTQSVESGSLSNDLESLPLEGQGGDKIYADEYIEAANKEANVSIDVATEGKGNAIGGGNYALGDQVALMAFPDEGYSFEGWYDGNELIGREYSYYFTARKDRSITARFAFEEKVSTKFIVEMPETYGSNALLAMYDTEDPSSVNMVISMYDGGFDGDMPLKMKGYDRNGGLVFEEEKTATFDGGFHYIVSGLDTTNWHRIEVFGQKGSQIATIKTSEELVDVQEVRLDKSELSLKEGESAKLTATVVPENATDKSVTWKSSNENAATVKDGAVLAIGEGTADVTVTTNSGGKTATAKVAVEKGDGQGVNPAVHVSGVSISPSVLVLSEKSAGKLTATVLPENATDKSMTWKSSNDGIATVNDGTVTGVSEGTAEITVTTNDGAKSATAKVTVEKGGQGSPITGAYYTLTSSAGAGGTIKPSGEKRIVESGTQSYRIKANDGYRISDVIIDGKSVGAVGMYTFSRIDRGHSIEARFSNTSDVSVDKVTLSTSNAIISAGHVMTIKATVTPENASNKNVAWKSSDSKIATVSSSGAVKGVGKGTATITATTEDGGKTASCTVTVKPISVKSIKLDKEAAKVAKGKTVTLKATVSPSNADNKSVSWKSSNKKIATVTSAGIVKAVKAGTATITVTTKDGNKKATCKVTVTNPVVKVKSVKLNRKSANVKKGKKLTLKAAISPSNATNKTVSWESSNKKIATVTGKGVVKGVKKGKATITVASKDGKKTAICKVTVR